jgi:hypothetical protein
MLEGFVGGGESQRLAIIIYLLQQFSLPRRRDEQYG